MSRLVLLTSDGIEHRYVADALAEAFAGELRAIILSDPPSRSRWAVLRKYFRRYTLSQIFSRLHAKAYAKFTHRDKRRTATYRRMLFSDGDPAEFGRPDLLRIVPGHNHEACLQLLRALEPDIIVVYGTGIIREGVIRLARTRILNMHTGISPRYRGSSTIFWALHNEEPEWVGVTIHVLDEGIDAGPVLCTGRPQIMSDDDEDSLFCKSLILGTELLTDAIRAVASGVQVETPQRLDEGREFRFVDQTVEAQRRVRKLLREGLLQRYGSQT